MQDVMKNKMTLKWQESKKKPGNECMYDGCYSSELLYRAHSKSLEVNAQRCRWDAANSKEYKLCGI